MVKAKVTTEAWERGGRRRELGRGVGDRVVTTCSVIVYASHDWMWVVVLTNEREARGLERERERERSSGSFVWLREKAILADAMLMAGKEVGTTRSES